MLLQMLSARRWVAGCAASLWIAGCAHGATQSEPVAPPAVVNVGDASNAATAKPSSHTQNRARAGVPEGYLELEVAGVAATEEGAAVILFEPEQKIAVPIFIGGTEALSISLRHKKQRYPRPLTHDLLDHIMKELGGELVKIHIDDIRDGTFIGAVFVRRGDRIIEVDARPSDAIALAIGHGVPIYVAKRVIEQAGVPRDELGPNGPGGPPSPSAGPQPI